MCSCTHSPGAICVVGEADDLAELADRLALADRLRGHLVTAQDALAGGQAGGIGALVHEVDGDDDVVIGVKADGTRSAHEYHMFQLNGLIDFVITVPGPSSAAARVSIPECR